MKKLEELGISPTPWGFHEQFVFENDVGSIVAVSNYIDARLIASAPELYECLREAVVESCVAYCGEHPIVCKKKDGECFVQKWRAALAKASGEEAGK